MAPTSATSCSERLASKLKATRSARNNRPEFRALIERITIRKMEAISLTRDKGLPCGEIHVRLHHLKTLTTTPLRERKRRLQAVSSHFLAKGKIAKRKKAPLGRASDIRASSGGSNKSDKPIFITTPLTNMKRSLEQFLGSNDDAEKAGHDAKRTAVAECRKHTLPKMSGCLNLTKGTFTTAITANPTIFSHSSSVTTTFTMMEELIAGMESLSLGYILRANVIRHT